MYILYLSRYLLTSCVAAAMLAGCSGSQPPIGAPVGATSAVVGKDQSLLYISDGQSGDIYMVSLPSGRLVGKLTGFNGPTGNCVDQHGNVFVDNSGEGQVRAYAHGAKTAFRVLNDSSWEPYACSVDRTTGNLAVCNLRTGQTLGTIAVYAKAKGAARHYRYSGVSNFWYCAYDGDGNLFADGVDYGSNKLMFLELPRGLGRLRPVSLYPAIKGEVSPALIWDGKYLAIASPNSAAINQYRMSGSTCRRVNIVKLDDADVVTGPFWIASGGTAKTLYAPIVANSIASVGVYRYPTGGKRLQNLYDAPNPSAAAVSAP